MMDSNKEKEIKQEKYDELLKKIDDIELIPNDELKNMDFYQLSYYMQTLNMIDSIDKEQTEVE